MVDKTKLRQGFGRRRRRLEMPKERDYRWYVEPLDDDTNKVVGRKKWEDSMLEGVRCSDGLRRNLWLCDRDLINALNKSKSSLNLRFRVYVQEGDGEIRPSFID